MRLRVSERERGREGGKGRREGRERGERERGRADIDSVMDSSCFESNLWCADVVNSFKILYKQG